jgi:hypothetical protein
VVVTPAALAGIDARPGTDVLLAATTADLVQQVLRALDGDAVGGIGRAARRFVLDRFLWRGKIERLEGFLTP